MALNVEWLGGESGWIDVEFSDGEHFFSLQFSFFEDPFDDIFFALENLDRRYPPHIIVDIEGPIFQIALVDKANGYEKNFTIRRLDGDKPGELLFECAATRDEIVQQMYGKLVEFARSERYDPRHYEMIDPDDDDDAFFGFHLFGYKNEKLENYLKYGVKEFRINYDEFEKYGDTQAWLAQKAKRKYKDYVDYLFAYKEFWENRKPGELWQPNLKKPEKSEKSEKRAGVKKAKSGSKNQATKDEETKN